MDEGGNRKVMIDANVTLMKKGRSGKENKKKENWATLTINLRFEPMLRTAACPLATQRAYTLYTPCDIIMTERGVMCIVR